MTPNEKLLSALADMAEAQLRVVEAMAELQSTGVLSVKEYADKYKVSKSHVYKMLEVGALKGRRIGTKWVVEEGGIQ
jgi:excisionase family DNA binding protein